MQLFGAPRGLLHEIAVFDGHADLMAESQQQPEFGGSKSPVVRRSQQQHAEGLFLGLQADGHHAAKPLREGQLPETSDRFFLFQRREGSVAQVAETEQAAEPRDQPNQVIVQPLFLRHAAEIVVQAHGYHRGWALRIAMMQKQRARRQPDHAEHSIQRLRQHALNFATDETRRGQVQIGERQHVALDAALFFFVRGHDHEHGHECGRHRGDRAEDRSVPSGAFGETEKYG